MNAVFTFRAFTPDMETYRFKQALRSPALALVVMRRYVREYAEQGLYSHITCNLPTGGRAKCSNRGGVAFVQVW
ncbi:hypothetical protein [Thiothrix nivea]|uniref:Uncharacterized protein n=1 Tax=Thiothrix nivea (strain ATCC 35100 / DSM 5205 / JP2) TaxID=870187 RepID=A0A656HLN1_THINJ|nr:hypothetical protein [Thiothrix nivea]EIJ36230.1 hypothetical protein Thini_3727 [Thiothrix nivea DSM 5205]